MSGLFSLHKQQILSEIMHAAVQSGTNVRSRSPKNQPSSSRQTSLVAKNKKSAYGTLHTEHQIEVNMYQKTLSCCKKLQKKSQPRNWFGE